MPNNRRSRSKNLALQATELAVAVPQVVTHRLTRLALAGANPSARDRREFQGMGHKKVVAFWQGWFGMGWAVAQASQRAGLAMLQGTRVPMFDTSAILQRGLAPVHRKATANARRLARTPLR